MKKFKQIISLFLMVLFIITLSNLQVYALGGEISSAKSSRNSKTIDAIGGNVSFNIRGTDLDISQFKVKAFLNGERISQIEDKFEFTNTPTIGLISAMTTIPQNTTTEIQTYSFEFSCDNGLTYFKNGTDADVAVKQGTIATETTSTTIIEIPHETTTTTEIPVETTSTTVKQENSIYGLSQSSFDLEAIAGDISVDLFLDKNTLNENIRAKAQINDEIVTLPYTVEGSGSRRTIKFNVPENKTTEPITYKVSFNNIASDSEYSEAHILTINVKAAEDLKSEIKSLTTKNSLLPLTGGTTNISVMGSNLKAEKVTLKAFKVEGNELIEVPKITKDITLLGVDTVLSTTLTFDKSTNETGESYIIKAYLDGVETKEIGIKLSPYGTNKPYAYMFPKAVAVNKSANEIIIQYNENIFEIGENFIKSNFMIDVNGDGNFINLDASDTTQVIEDRIIIKTQLVSSLTSKSKFKILENTIKDSKDSHGKEFIGSLSDNTPTIFTTKYIKGQLLNYLGGEVEIEIDGANLISPDMTNGTMILVKQVGKEDITIPATITGEGDTQIIKFTLPENKGTTSLTYLVQLSLNGGRTYSSKIGLSNYHMGDKLASTVLPKEVENDKTPTLSYLTIQSYGTSGGNTEEPDQTHTNVPVLQESKKTLVHVYGANLDSKLTKIRVRDANGVVWYPVREPNSDSMDQFIMVAFNGTGITGDGNTQLLEVICPRNIIGDNTYTYEVAVDGVNYNQSITVNATVLDDKAPGKFDNKKELREISVSLLDDKGNVIKNAKRKDKKEFVNPIKVLGYSWLRYKIVGVSTPELEGYELVPVADNRVAFIGNFLGGNDISSDSLDSVIGNNTDFRFVYRSTIASDPVITTETPTTVETSTSTTSTTTTVEPTTSTTSTTTTIDPTTSTSSTTTTVEPTTSTTSTTTTVEPTTSTSSTTTTVEPTTSTTSTTTTVEPTTSTTSTTTTVEPTTSTTSTTTTIEPTTSTSSTTTTVEPTTSTSSTTTTVEPTTSTEEVATYELKSETFAYNTAVDALNRINSFGKYKAGLYFIYKVDANGMINISKDKNISGAWINPNQDPIIESTTTTIVNNSKPTKNSNTTKTNNDKNSNPLPNTGSNNNVLLPIIGLVLLSISLLKRKKSLNK